MDNFGYTQPQTTAKARCWLPREEKAVETLMVLGKFPTDLLGLDLLKGRSWTNDKGKIWAFEKETQHLCLLSSAPALPPSLGINVKPYSLSL